MGHGYKTVRVETRVPFSCVSIPHQSSFERHKDPRWNTDEKRLENKIRRTIR